MGGARLPLTAGNQSTENTNLTLASRAYAALRREIITGNYAPGRKLRIQTLCRQFGVGLSPMREALTRLSREGLVLHEDQRGFRVRPVDQGRLDELTKTRCWLNAVGLRESIANGDDKWEEEVLIAFHRMSKYQPFISEDGRAVINRDWDIEHRGFHRSLISACGSHWLIAFCEQLSDAADFYRHITPPSEKRLTSRGNEHENILKAALARDTEVAVGLLVEHFTRSADLIRDQVGEEEDDEHGAAAAR
jgi:DNA-binding GntR family transcriptional regulator